MARRLITALAAGGSDRRRRQGRAIAALTLAVAAGHGCVVERMAARMSDAKAAAAMPARMSVIYVREMTVTAPHAVAAAPPAIRAHSRRPRAPRPAAPALPVVVAAVADTSPPADVPPSPDASPAAGVDATASVDDPAVPPGAAASAAAGAASAPPFEWPDSTRMSYRLTGNYRGPVGGTAQVEWIRSGSRYQLHLDVSVGPAVAPLMRRRMSSEGRLTGSGLAPERYDEETDRLFGQRRRVGLRFEPDAVVLANGERATGWPDVQDAVSQFVQLTFLMTTQPALARPGSSVAMALALPRRVAPWVYEVLEPELLATPFGPLQSAHLRPRVADRHGSDLTAQVWIAPQLQYLPVRIRIEQDADTFIDLMIDRLPQLAAATEPGAANAAPAPQPEISNDR